MIAFRLVSGFYGSVVNMRNMHDKSSRLTSMPASVLHLAELRHFWHISDDEDGEKGKAGRLARVRVIWQATWKIPQCISRKAPPPPHIFHREVALLLIRDALFSYTTVSDIEKPAVITTAGVEEYQPT